MNMTITTIDAHTAGSSTRIITSGLPEIPGDTMCQKMEYFSKHHDDIRKALILEPRGHQNMWGAVLTKPTQPEADIGAFFLNSIGCMPICVHSKISLVKAAIERNLIATPAEGKPVIIDVPLGMRKAYPTIENGKVTSVSVESSPAFVHTSRIKLLLETGNFINASIVYSGVFFLLIDVNQVGFYDGRSELLKSPEGIQRLVKCAINVLNQVNKKYLLHDPRNLDDIEKIDMVMFYDELNATQANDVVITSAGSIDRCPCGSAAGAKLAQLYQDGKIGLEQSYELFSPIKTRFAAKILGKENIGEQVAITPMVTGSPHITGDHTFYVNDQDSTSSGFIL